MGKSPAYTQSSRPMRVRTPLPDDTLLLETVAGTEELSRPFRFTLFMLADEEADVPFDKLLGQGVTVEFGPDDAPDRVIHGIVSEITQGGSLDSDVGGPRFTRYTAVVVPELWLLTRTARSRLFQWRGVDAILEEVLTAGKVRFDLTGQYKAREYCVQYRETDFAFASRLMEEEGIWYYFEHAADGHTLVLCDAKEAHSDLDPVAAPFQVDPAAASGDVVLAFERRQRIRSGKVTLWDYTFQMPTRTDHLEAVGTQPATVRTGDVTHKRTAGGAGEFELYDHPGGYADRFDGISASGGKQPDNLNNVKPDGERTAKLRIEEQVWPGVTAGGQSNCRRFAPGYRFELTNHPDANGGYVLVKVEHAADQEGVYTGGAAAPFVYRNHWTAIPDDVPFRPERLTPRPIVHGPETAKVVGPAGKEIHCDPYGRVRVQFHWDRDGGYDGKYACWVRVATPWAGQNWGMIHIPRVGHEVLVGFEGGDPDRPVIVGSVYNDALMPPYTLPDLMSQSGVKSRSTPGGDDSKFNELRFEDKTGAEQVYFHAERDFVRVVENNDSTKVGFEKKDKGDQAVEIFNNQSLKVGAGQGDAADGSQAIDVWNSQTLTVGSGQGSAKDGSQTVTIYKDRTITVQTGNETLKVNTGNRLVEVATGNDTHTVKTGNRVVSVDLGNDTLTIKTGNQETKVSLGKSTTEAMQSIELKVGPSLVRIDPSGITLSGINVKVEGKMMVQVQGAVVDVAAEGMLKAKGAITIIG